MNGISREKTPSGAKAMEGKADGASSFAEAMARAEAEKLADGSRGELRGCSRIFEMSVHGIEAGERLAEAWEAETKVAEDRGVETLSLFVVALWGEGTYTNEPFSVSCTVDMCRALRCKT